VGDASVVKVFKDYDISSRRTLIRADVHCSLNSIVSDAMLDDEKEVCRKMLRQILEKVSKDFVAEFNASLKKGDKYV